VVADAGNGMAGHVVPASSSGLPFELVPMYFELDGNFPNHPADPLNPENLRELQAGWWRGRRRRPGLRRRRRPVFLVDERGATVPPAWSGRWWPG
jgi:phosphomannomutase